MWIMKKIRESMESIPLELSRYIGLSEDEFFLRSKASLSYNLPNNILTPDKIPEFCLPPQLCKKNLLQEVETRVLHQHFQIPMRSISSNTMNGNKDDVKRKSGGKSVPVTSTKKPLPFSAEAYGLAGIYERPNTRRKESLFHSRRPVYMVDRRIPTPLPKLAEEGSQAKKTLSGFLPLVLCKSLSETKSSESDFSPLSSSHAIKSSTCSGRLKGATSCPSLTDNREDRGNWREKREAISLTTSTCYLSSPEGHSQTSALSVLFPPQSQEKLQQEYVLSLQGQGKVHLLAELTTLPSKTNSAYFTVRVRVMSVEEINHNSDRHALNCALILCLTPGMLQQQESTTIRNCLNPVFNEDFYFTELSKEDLVKLQLRLKVVNKPAAAGLRRRTVMGVITRPLSQLLQLKSYFMKN
ncbi:C2 calcium-dependent domain-containing protein 4C-like [Xyrichtys novacula]|uniref:C2 calcium-dependent domain-containing protein 4C-like n=1 Tax=Xyrichtys novacula TaxID=13765 RepID=A0AAV1G523_XYRNO|nr:C2 calcium-dependent domain-containing protein 4C-like [Xyrichtys novacula]